MPTSSHCGSEPDGELAFALRDSGPFVLSDDNFFVVIGCRSQGTCNASNLAGDSSLLDCSTACYNQYAFPFCSPYACCITALPPGSRFLNFTGNGINYEDYPDVCGFSTVLSPETFISTGSYFGRTGHYGLNISWGILLTAAAPNCSTVNKTHDYVCAENSQCEYVGRVPGYVCSCNKGYRGDGYKEGLGCEDIDECLSGDNDCAPPPRGRCTNTPGSYNCSCNEGYQGDGYKKTLGCKDIDECATGNNNCEPPPLGICTNTPGSYNCSCANGMSDGLRGNCTGDRVNTIKLVAVGVGAAVLMLVLVILIAGAYRARTVRRRKEENFRRNGGEGLLQHISSLNSRDSGRRKLEASLFSPDELQRATQNFTEDNKLGSGAFGTVYRGELANPPRVVAIKKAKNMEADAVGQFINEILLLGQVDHPNIVKLLGCCLHTEVPLLVYEYVDNGTLFERLQEVRNGTRQLSWEMRLLIAVQSAEALTHLHSTSPPILHRDIKAANILLDQSCRPKIADFGASHFLPSDHTHLSVDMLVFTMGYLDPEYHRLNKFTDKSDVYSFGVVLLELITAEPAFSGSPLVQRYFASLQTGELESLLDQSIVGGGAKEVMSSVRQVAHVATRCFANEGRRRPSMREVCQDLRRIEAKFRGKMSSMPPKIGCEGPIEYTNLMGEGEGTQEDHEKTYLLSSFESRSHGLYPKSYSSSSIDLNTNTNTSTISSNSIELISFSSSSRASM